MKYPYVKYTNALLIISLFLALTGCGGECETIGDCPNKECFTKRCTSEKECAYDVKSDCCGNEVCEDGENMCTCPNDCGKCSGSSGEYLEKRCTTEDECIEVVKGAVSKRVSDDDKLKDVEIDLIAEYNQPFSTDSDQITLTIRSRQDLVNKVNFLIESVQLVLVKSGASNILYETDVGLGLYNKDSEISLIMPVKLSADEPMEEYLTVSVAYSYEEYRSNKRNKVADTEEIRLKEKITFVDPDGDSCPASCDDDNDCTKDHCSKETEYKCEHDPIMDCVSNWICEEGENKCTAPFDCGACSGAYLSTMELECEQKKCYKKITSSQTKVQTEEKSIQVCDLDIRFTYTNPSDVLQDNISVDISMLNAEDTFVTPFTIKNIELYEGSILIGEKAVGGSLAGPGKSINNIEIPFNIPFEFDEQEKTVNVKVNYEYSKLQRGEKTGPFRESFSVRLDDRIVFANTGLVEGR